MFSSGPFFGRQVDIYSQPNAVVQVVPLKVRIRRNATIGEKIAETQCMVNRSTFRKQNTMPPPLTFPTNVGGLVVSYTMLEQGPTLLEGKGVGGLIFPF